MKQPLQVEIVSAEADIYGKSKQEQTGFFINIIIQNIYIQLSRNAHSQNGLHSIISEKMVSWPLFTI